MKTCNNCKSELTLDNFYSSGYTPKGSKKYKPNCKKCDRVVKRRNHWKKIEEIYGPLECYECGYDRNLAVLEFHHIERDDKNFNLSYSKSFSSEKLAKEISKCILLCANCHRERHNEGAEKSTILEVT